MTLQVLGQRIQYYRLQRGWTTKELGTRIGMSHASIVRLEQGRQNIYVPSLFALAEALDVTLWQILGDEEDFPVPRPLPPSLQELLVAVLPLNPAAVAHLTAFVLTLHKAS